MVQSGPSPLVRKDIGSAEEKREERTHSHLAGNTLQRAY